MLVLQSEMAELRARLDQNSRNSSRPPSSDPPDVRAQRPAPPPSGRKPGGQPGHKGTTRCVLPPDEIVAWVPSHCEQCGTALPEDATEADPAPRVHQVVELPPVALHVTHHHQHGRTCAGCGRCTWGRLPPGVPPREEGPRLQAFLALLTGRFRLSRRQAQELLRDLFGWAPALGTLVGLEAATSQALAPVIAAVTAALATAPSLYVDETGWRQGKERPTLWVVVTETAVLFRLGRRDGETFAGLLTPAPLQVVVSDRYVVYDGVPLAGRQLCWAHLARNFQALLERPDGAVVAHWAKDEIRRLFQAWHRFQRGELTRQELQAALVPVQEDFRTLLRLGAAGPCGKTATLCQQLLERWEALWTFAYRDGVEPTNNRAERALRPAVLWRKSSFGHKSESGKQFVERLLTVAGTLRLQGRPVLGFLEAVCRAALTGAAVPDILAAQPA